MSSEKIYLVLYHANCPDGFCAAWVAHKVLGERAEYRPVQYNQDPPDVSGKLVYILDFSYPRHVLKSMASQAEKIIILDHHATAEQELANFTEPNVFITFNMEKSGGRLAWEYFYPSENIPLQAFPWLVSYTEDRDLWRWALPGSREINSALASYPRDFATWDDLDLRRNPESLDTEGTAIERYKTILVNSICAQAQEIELDGHKIRAVNTSVLISEVAGQLALGRPFGAAWFIRGDGKKQWSLRSTPDGLDVAELAYRHGGGGHRHAAGYEEFFASLTRALS